MSKAFQIFIGYDPRQPVAYHVAYHSAVTFLSKPVPVTRLQLSQLPITRRGLTEFTYSRFLVPYLSEFDGYSLFLDADMLVLHDLWKLFDYIDPSAAVSVVLHEGERKFERPSLMLFNNKRCAHMTPAFVEDPTNRLFDMAWSSKTHGLPKDWNHLVGYDAPNPNAKVVHYTMGVPCWPETQHCEFASQWHECLKSVESTVTFNDLMGGSVHPAAKTGTVPVALPLA